MFEAYSRIFRRAGLEFRAVEADTGQIGGSSSHEFMVLADSGEDVIVSCPECGYGSNIEKTEAVAGENSAPASSDIPAMKEVETPGMGSIEEVSAFLKLKPENFIKTLIYSVNGTEECVAVLVRGDYDISEPKLRNLLSAQDVELAQPEQVKRITGAAVGFAGPQKLACKIVADNSIRGITAGVTGANRDDYHATNVVEGRDFKPDIFGDIRLVRQGDPCPACRNADLEFHRGIEVGHIFRLGTKYSKAMKATYLDRDGKEQVIVMGTYGIGIARIAAAAIEQSHDENGIIWPESIAPFDVIILPLNARKENVLKAAVEMEKELEEAGFEVLLDDREERAGVKFNDADLIGIPVQVIIGEKGLAGGEVEIKLRKSGTRMKVKRDEAAKKVAETAGSK
jgi:prolyl-tRNA synthetase